MNGFFESADPAGLFNPGKIIFDVDNAISARPTPVAAPKG